MSGDFEVAVVGAGVVGSGCALALARRGVAVALLEAEAEPGLQASGTNSGILHTGFDSAFGELETDLILRAASLRDPVLETLAVPVVRCGAEMAPRDTGDAASIAAIAANARGNGVAVALRDDGVLEVPGESVTDPVAYTLALCVAAQRHRARLFTGFGVTRIEHGRGSMRVTAASGEAVSARVVVNGAGIGAGAVARMLGDDSFDVYPRKGEFLVFDPPTDGILERILLPVPTPRTKGVLVFPTVDGRIVAGPTAVDLDRPDWSVRPEAREEILPKASRMHPPLADAEPVFAYAGLRPAGRAVNYVIARSRAEPALVNVAAIRSTGLTASLAIAERVVSLVAAAGVPMSSPEALAPGPPPAAEGEPWWRRSADRLAV
ncbi:MAG: FAD-dependent oxidoreductase [Solirubrobacterales bacterium]|jgi:glycerol-3-phosphate dehydrogenase|nr:FAD-dependent oxidoreductase [Solirubrobacterales bacterium]